MLYSNFDKMTSMYSLGYSLKNTFSKFHFIHLHTQKILCFSINFFIIFYLIPRDNYTRTKGRRLLNFIFFFIAFNTKPIKRERKNWSMSSVYWWLENGSDVLIFISCRKSRMIRSHGEKEEGRQLLEWE